jgi:nucleoside-diphosphate-sugar epimerase
MSSPLENPVPRHHHLILGDGVVGRGVADELTRRRLPHTLASRTPSAHPSPHRRVDALDRDALLAACADASHVYVTLGLRYHLRTWQRDWPAIVDNLIAAARAHPLRLVFFDNVYAYGQQGAAAPLQVPMTEDHPQHPPSRKGAVRKEIDDALLRAGLDLVIARSADFYGPGVRNSALYVAAMERQAKGKAAQWIGTPDRLHSYTYTVDAARALVRLALDPDARGVWHLPTAEPATTTRALLEQSARLLGAPTTIQVLPGPIVALLSLAMPVLREVREMLYQNRHDYVFSSAKFMRRYPDFEVTPYDQGIAAMVDALRADAGARYGGAAGARRVVVDAAARTGRRYPRTSAGT